MASSYSTSLKLELIGTGEQSGTWGSATNTNLGTAVEQAIVGRGNPVFSTDADLTITLSNSSAAQTARAFVLTVTSGVSLTATRNLVVPTIEKPYVVMNNTTGGRSIVVKTSAGTGITVPNGARMFLYVDGTNVLQMLTKDSVGLGNVDNTSDINKPISTATQAALDLKANASGVAAAVSGPASATDNALVRFDGTTGKLVQNSNVTIDDLGVASFGGPIMSGGANTITDWNAITQTGWYMAAGASNAPVAGVWFIGYSVSHNNDWITQEVWRFSDNTDTDIGQFRREKNNGTWGSWVRVYGTAAEITGIVDAEIAGKADLSGATFTGNVSIGAGGAAPTKRLEVGRLGGGMTVTGVSATTAVLVHPGGGSDGSGAEITLAGGAASDVGIRLGPITAASTAGLIYSAATGNLALRNSSANRLTIDASGNATFSGNVSVYGAPANATGFTAPVGRGISYQGTVPYVTGSAGAFSFKSSDNNLYHDNYDGNVHFRRAGYATTLSLYSDGGAKFEGALTVAGSQVAAYNYVIGDQTSGNAGTYGFTNGLGPSAVLWGNTSPGGGQYQITTNGSVRFAIASNGVAIFYNPVDLRSALNISNSQYIYWADASGGFSGGVSGATQVKYSDNHWYFQNFDGDIIFQGASYAERMRIRSDGNATIVGNTRFGSAGATSGGAAIQVIKAESYAARFANSAGLSSVVALSLDPGNNGENQRDSQIRATNNGANQTTLELFTANAAAPTKKLNITHTGLITAENSVGFGYGGGSGGTVTQATSKSTGVTLNKPSGRITMSSSSLGGLGSGTETATFQLTNSTIGAADTVVVTPYAHSSYRIDVYIGSAGACTISVTNMLGYARAEAVQLNFTVIKGSLS